MSKWKVGGAIWGNGDDPGKSRYVASLLKLLNMGGSKMINWNVRNNT